MGICHKEINQKIKSGITFEEEIKRINEKNSKNISGENELKIELYPNNIPKDILKKRPIIYSLPEDMIGLSLDKEKTLAFFSSNVPLLEGFYSAHCNHYPIRIKPDDIWLLIVQAFSYHVNINSKKLRNYFVNFEGKKNLVVKYRGIFYMKNVDKKTLEDFSIQINKKIEKYLGEEIVKDLTSDFSTTNYDSLVISKLSIMGAFKKYFNYKMGLTICGIPYIILEGTLEDYENIKKKAKKLRIYEFSWYIDRIIPHIEKMIDAKKGNIDINYFKDIIQKNEVFENTAHGCIQLEKVDKVTGWILDFFAYKKNLKNKFERFSSRSLIVEDFNQLAGQMLMVPFTIKEEITGKTYNMKYNVGFIGCDQNEKKEVIPVQGWVVSPLSEKDEESIL